MYGSYSIKLSEFACIPLLLIQVKYILQWNYLMEKFALT